jgi:hypothetical protein
MLLITESLAMKTHSICFAVFVLLFLARAAFGCSCTELGPAKAFDQARSVFIGKMIDGKRKNSRDNIDGTQLEALDATFQVDSGLETYKGVRSRRSVIVNLRGRDGAACELPRLVPGEKYFVYATSGDKDPGDPANGGSCVRIAPVNGSEDVEFIRGLNEIGYGTIVGYMSLDTHEIAATYSRPPITYLQTVSLKITGPGRYLRTVPLDSNGNFEITSLRKGRYRLTPRLPANYESANESVEITIAGFGMIYPPAFRVQYKSRVVGVLRDVKGIGFDQTEVYLENSKVRVPGGSVDPSGRFQIRGVPPGEYVMYVELRGEDLYVTRKYYFPGTYDVDRARRIRIGLSDLKTGLQFTLPAEFRVRTN